MIIFSWRTPVKVTADATAPRKVMTAIWQESPAHEWTLLKPTGFPNEKTLHDLAAAAPELLPLSGAPRLIVLGREVRQLG